MSRVRLGYALACLGILITTGGCAESATAPSAANVEASADRSTNPTTADDGAVAPVKPAPASDTDVTVSGGVILSGGGRSDP
jgi:hypothetical protein